MRLNRYLARAGIASRRKAEELITSGKVFVNGLVVTELATEVDPTEDSVEVGGEIILLPEHKYYVLNKPAGYTCTRADAHAEHTVFELLPDDPSLISVGRLDRDTTGLLLITNDGDFAQNIIHPSNKIRKTYFIKLQKPSNKLQIEKLKAEIMLEDGPARAVDTKIIGNKEIELTIEEGRKRIVRRMIKAVGNEVEELKRTQVGNIVLDVEIGQYRELTDKEVANYA
jgi:23S rRNA pseudouridine2605 synthase